MKLRILFPGLMIVLSMLACNFPVSAPATKTKELFSLFPKGPAKKVAKISGLGKPEGCV